MLANIASAASAKVSQKVSYDPRYFDELVARVSDLPHARTAQGCQPGNLHVNDMGVTTQRSVARQQQLAAQTVARGIGKAHIDVLPDQAFAVGAAGKVHHTVVFGAAREFGAALARQAFHQHTLGAANRWPCCSRKQLVDTLLQLAQTRDFSAAGVSSTRSALACPDALNRQN